MKPLQQSFKVTFNYQVYFTNNLFNLDNKILKEVVEKDGNQISRKVLFVVDEGVSKEIPSLIKDITKFVEGNKETFRLPTAPIVIPGGEMIKNDRKYFEKILNAINKYGIDRHSYVVAVGGGALLDMVGFASSIAHRGIRHIRIPTTVLSQNDSGVGVKNSINAFNKKNFLGTFNPPYAVINDFNFLLTLNEKDWRGGISEAIKVALIKDKSFFEFIQSCSESLLARDTDSMKHLIYRCAEMHLNHIASGDPFEKGSSRPLDFGHWAAHKLEQLTKYEVRHGEAVATGIALDCTYSYLKGMLAKEEWKTIISLIKSLEFRLFYPEMGNALLDLNHPENILKGLTEFREHLGGKLTIMLLERIGKGVEVHSIDTDLMIQSIELLKQLEEEKQFINKL